MTTETSRGSRNPPFYCGAALLVALASHTPWHAAAARLRPPRRRLRLHRPWLSRRSPSHAPLLRHPVLPPILILYHQYHPADRLEVLQLALPRPHLRPMILRALDALDVAVRTN